MQSIYEQLVQIVNANPHLLTSHRNDLEEYDRNACNEMQTGDTLIWILTTCGTHLFWIESPATSDFDKVESDKGKRLVQTVLRDYKGRCLPLLVKVQGVCSVEAANTKVVKGTVEALTLDAAIALCQYDPIPQRQPGAALVIQCDEHLAEVRALAVARGLAETLQQALDQIDLFAPEQLYLRIFLFQDLAPLSFGYSMRLGNAKDGIPRSPQEGEDWLHGGLIFHEWDNTWGMHS